MDKKSKVFLWVFFLLIVGSVAVTYWRIMIKKDYVIEAQADCDPTTEKCFVYHCDEAAGECTGNPEEDTSYFKKAQRIAANIPLCDPADENCKPWDCTEGENDCSITLCDETTKGEDDECNDPEQYLAENPADEEEATTCEEGDASCVASSDEEATTCDPENGDACVVPVDTEAPNSENKADVNKEDAVDDKSSQTE